MILGGDGTPPTVDQLFAIDDRLAEKGVPVFRRPSEAARMWSEETGDLAIALKQESWFRDAFAKMHPSVPFEADAFLTLCVSARGVSYALKPPMGYGRIRVVPLSYVAVTEQEKGRLFHAHPGAFWEMQWQAVDGIDLFMARMNYHPERLAANMMTTAINQLTASARQLIACEIDSSVPQGMAMATELAGKSILAFLGVPTQQLRQLGHDLPRIFSRLATEAASPIDSEVISVAATLPRYVDVRYDAPSMNILDAQDIYRRTLFVIADALRRINHDQLYWKLVQDSSLPPRSWR